MSTIKDFVRGSGRTIEPGYRVGDTWVQTVGPHSNCSSKIFVLGPGIGADRHGRVGNGVLVRCGGCLLSWVIR